MRFGLLVILTTLLSGCTRYEYEIVQPPDLARHIGQSENIVRLDPLEYGLRSDESVLVMRVFNPTEDMVQLIGTQSVVVDPRGQSRPLLDQAIAPHSFVKLLFPPPRPTTFWAPRTTWGVGVGTTVGRRGPQRVLNDASDAAPKYLSVSSDDADPFFWEWSGGGAIRVTLVYQQGDRTWRNDFTFRRVRAR